MARTVLADFFPNGKGLARLKRKNGGLVKAKSNENRSSDPVLPWPYETYRQLYKDWHRIQVAAGIPEDAHYVPKNCRSTCASELIANQVPTVVVKDFLGHATVATTENYYINTKPAMRAAAQARKVQIESENSIPPVPETDASENSKQEM